MNIHKLPESLKIKVDEYFQYTWKKQNLLNQHHNFRFLSDNLLREVYFYLHYDIVAGVPLFEKLKTNELFSIIQKLKAHIFLPSDQVIKKGDKGDCMYFIDEGSVVVILNETSQVILTVGQYFGEIALMTDTKRMNDVESLDFSCLQQLSKKDYQEIIQTFPGIQVRINEGLKSYSNIDGIKQIKIFNAMDDEELKKIQKFYVDQIQIIENQVILRPMENYNALYFVSQGIISVLPNNEDSKIKIQNFNQIIKGLKQEQSYDLYNYQKNIYDCIDSNLKFIKFQTDDENIIRDFFAQQQKIYTGSMFGGINDLIYSNSYYISDSNVKLFTLKIDKFKLMQKNHPSIFEKLQKQLVLEAIEYKQNLSINNLNDLKISSQQQTSQRIINECHSSQLSNLDIPIKPTESQTQNKMLEIQTSLQSKSLQLQNLLQNIKNQIKEISEKSQTNQKI